MDIKAPETPPESTPDTAPGAPPRRILGPAAFRFAAVSGCAFAVDMVLSLALRALFDLPLFLATGISFALVAAGAYFVHEHWTFAGDSSRAHAGRFLQTLLVTACAIVSRMLVVAGLEIVRAPEGWLPVVYLLIGGAVSISVNYLLSRFWVFAARP